MYHLAAFVQSVDPAGVLLAITAAREEMFFTSGADFRVPPGLKFIAGYGAAINDLTVAPSAQIQAPSLRIQTNLDVQPILNAANFGAGLQAITLFPETPIELNEDEALNFAMLSNPAAGVIHAGLVFLADGPLAPATGKVFTIRATAAITQVAAAWVNGNLTLQQVLPAGEYAVVGARFQSADAIAMRLVFSAQVARPGLPSAILAAAVENPSYRAGKMGVWGQFPNTIPPTLDVIGGAGVAQTVFLDLLRIS